MNGPRRRRGDGGFTLIELVVAVAIMGVCFVTIVAGMMASIFTSDIHRRQATAETVIRAYAEYVTQQQYVSCAGTGAYGASTPTGRNSAPLTLPSGFSAQTTSVAHWNGTAYSSSTTGPGPVSGCTDTGTQLVSIKATDSTGRDSETIDVVARTQ